MDNAINCVLKLCLKVAGPFPAKCHNCLVLEAFKAVRILSFLCLLNGIELKVNRW